MNSETGLDELVDDLLVIQARILVLEALYTKFVNIVGHDNIPQQVQAAVGDQLRDERLKLTETIRNYLGGLR